MRPTLCFTNCVETLPVSKAQRVPISLACPRLCLLPQRQPDPQPDRGRNSKKFKALQGVMTGENTKLHLNLGFPQAFCSSCLTQEPNSANISLPQLCYIGHYACYAANEKPAPALYSGWKKKKFIGENKFRHQCLSAVCPKITNYKSCTLISPERELKLKKKELKHPSTYVQD